MTKEQLLDFIAQYDAQKATWRKLLNSRSKSMQWLNDFAQILPAGDITDKNRQTLNTILASATDKDSLTARIFSKIALITLIKHIHVEPATMPKIDFSLLLFTDINANAIEANALFHAQSDHSKQLPLTRFWKQPPDKLREQCVQYIVCKLIQNPDSVDFSNIPDYLLQLIDTCLKQAITSMSLDASNEKLKNMLAEKVDINNKSGVFESLSKISAAFFQPTRPNIIPQPTIIILGPEVDPNARNPYGPKPT